ncbi:hypothetical protein AKJ53_01500 [candidate division MSBL1 archaeon SCGC-AAA382F02]|uniref:Uncharacterized protein n=1 Tax=candidate division MSBL1 archaeon SCGC-AAA382F02 TaxID=1698282 RepID=A0A133VHX0_9EURY|nr:hypothetical protein AKJ53_01500 [candidate division MSBL1 archaeon SCGC-AAA382F02]
MKLKEPMKIETEIYGPDTKTALFPKNSVFVVPAETADMWVSEDLVEIIPLTDEEFEEMEEQRKKAKRLDLFPKFIGRGKENVVEPESKGKEIKASLGL